MRDLRQPAIALWQRAFMVLVSLRRDVSGPLALWERARVRVFMGWSSRSVET
jgi:hypothetical protein